MGGCLPGSIEPFTEEFFDAATDLPPDAVHEVLERLTLPADLPAGDYHLSIGVVDTNEKPVVQLGIAGRDETGWYPLSQVQVRR
jgi:hypothetical protein